VPSSRPYLAPIYVPEEPPFTKDSISEMMPGTLDWRTSENHIFCGYNITLGPFWQRPRQPHLDTRTFPFHPPRIHFLLQGLSNVSAVAVGTGFPLPLAIVGAHKNVAHVGRYIFFHDVRMPPLLSSSSTLEMSPRLLLYSFCV
jgi:hypothetical protein